VVPEPVLPQRVSFPHHFHSRKKREKNIPGSKGKSFAWGDGFSLEALLSGHDCIQNRIFENEGSRHEEPGKSSVFPERCQAITLFFSISFWG
jgi:hypothetical protein